MPLNVSLYQAHTEANKGQNQAGNKSLTTLGQAIPPFSGSGVVASQNSVKYNSGNLSGEFAGQPVTTVTPTMINVSLGNFEQYYNQRGFNDGNSLELPQMTYKYVPTGWVSKAGSTHYRDWGNYADSVNWELDKQTATGDSRNSFFTPNRNTSTDQIPQSSSAALEILNSQSFSSLNMPFSGVIELSGNSSNFGWVDYVDGRGAIIPPGSGSYKYPSFQNQYSPQELRE